MRKWQSLVCEALVLAVGLSLVLVNHEIIGGLLVIGGAGAILMEAAV